MDLYTRQELLLMVRALYCCMEEKWAEVGRRVDLSPAQQHILFLLLSNGQCMTPTRISELGCWHLSTVTRLLKPLKEKGLIEMKTNPEKSRYKIVSVTDAGKLLLLELCEFVKQMNDFPIKDNILSEAEVQQFLFIGKKIIDSQKGSDYREHVIQAYLEGVAYI